VSQYKVIFKSSADRKLRKLPAALQRRIVGEVEALANNPRPRGVVKLARHEDLWRIRVGDYHIVYEIRDNRLVILVLRLAHRKDVFQP
jgi:mRNA interferase RelE/StbE